MHEKDEFPNATCASPLFRCAMWQGGAGLKDPASPVAASLFISTVAVAVAMAVAA